MTTPATATRSRVALPAGSRRSEAEPGATGARRGRQEPATREPGVASCQRIAHGATGWNWLTPVDTGRAPSHPLDTRKTLTQRVPGHLGVDARIPSCRTSVPSSVEEESRPAAAPGGTTDARIVPPCEVAMAFEPDSG